MSQITSKEKNKIIKGGVSSPPLLFDRHILRKRYCHASSSFPDFLENRWISTIAERLIFTRRRFSRVLIIGAPQDRVQDFFVNYDEQPEITIYDLSPRMRTETQKQQYFPTLVGDEEFLAVAAQKFDLVISFFHLHRVNDLPGCLWQIRHILEPDGLFLGGLIGGNSLIELRNALHDAEYALKQGIHPRVSPMLSAQDAGALLQRAGFSLPVVDADALVILYSSCAALFKDLRAHGQSNILSQRQKTCASRQIFKDAADIYAQNFADENGLLPATLETIYISAWSPSLTQPRPLKPGSAQLKLQDFL